MEMGVGWLWEPYGYNLLVWSGPEAEMPKLEPSWILYLLAGLTCSQARGAEMSPNERPDGGSVGSLGSNLAARMLGLEPSCSVGSPGSNRARTLLLFSNIYKMHAA